MLVAAQIPQHVDDVDTLVRFLIDEFDVDVGFLVANEKTAAAVSHAGYRTVGGLDSTAQEVLQSQLVVASVRRRLREAMRALAGGRESTAFAAAAERAVRTQLSEVLLEAAAAARTFGTGAAEVLVTSNPTSLIGRAASRVAHARGLAVVGLEHGSMFPNDPRWDHLPVDVMCVWGESSRRALETSGVEKERLRVTGAPRFDRDQNDKISSEQPARDNCVLVATSGAGDHVSLDEHLRFVATVAQAIDESPPQRWVVKLHPKDRKEFYTQRAFLRNEVELVDGAISRASIDTYLRDATCLVTVSSTTAIDAMRARVPVIALWLAAGDSPPEFIARTAARIVHDSAGLSSSVASAQTGSLATPGLDYLEEHFAHRGEASGLVAREIVNRMSSLAKLSSERPAPLRSGDA